MQKLLRHPVVSATNKSKWRANGLGIYGACRKAMQNLMRQFLTWIDYLVTCAVVFTLFWQTYITVLKKLPQMSHFSWKLGERSEPFEFLRQKSLKIFLVIYLNFRAKNHFWVAPWFIQIEREGEFTTFFFKINNAFIVKMISLSCKKARLLVGYYLKCLQKWLNHGLGRSKVEHNWHSMKFIARMTTLSASEVKKEIKLRDQWTIKNEIDLWQMISIHCKWLCD